MARILYGLMGQGFGHAARGHEMLSHLVEQDHEVLVLTYGQALETMSASFPTIEIPGLGLNYQNNRVDYPRTLYDNAAMLVKTRREWPTLLSALKKFKPQLVITDYEPISTGIAHRKRLPLISFDNQHQLTNTTVTVPQRYWRDLLAVKLLTKSIVWGADAYLITSFFKTPITRPKTFLFPPVVRREVDRLKPTLGDYILVYQNSDFDSLVIELKKIPQQKFVVFSGRSKQGREDNVEFRQHHPKTFLTALSRCRAVIATAGASLISEAIRLNKPYFALPVARQVEQIINALYVKKLGFGTLAETFTATRGKTFIKNLPRYRAALLKAPKENSEALFNKIDSLIASLTSHKT